MVSYLFELLKANFSILKQEQLLIRVTIKGIYIQSLDHLYPENRKMLIFSWYMLADAIHTNINVHEYELAYLVCTYFWVLIFAVENFLFRVGSIFKKFIWWEKETH